MIVMRFFIIFVRICKFGKLVILNIILECGVFIFIYRIRIMVDLKIGIVGRLIIINYEYWIFVFSILLFISNFVEINVFK